MQIEVKVGNKWRTCDAAIDAQGRAIVKLPRPYESKIFGKGKWRNISCADSSIGLHK
jgi:hypothetical protein